VEGLRLRLAVAPLTLLLLSAAAAAAASSAARTAGQFTGGAGAERAPGIQG